MFIIIREWLFRFINCRLYREHIWVYEGDHKRMCSLCDKRQIMVENPYGIHMEKPRYYWSDNG
jgi:hypothetical protein